MMRYRCFCTTFLALALASPLGFPAQGAGGDTPSGVWRYVDLDTLWIMRCDLASLTRDRVSRECARLLDVEPYVVSAVLDVALKKLIADSETLRRLDGHELFHVLSLADFSMDDYGLHWLVFGQDPARFVPAREPRTTDSGLRYQRAARLDSRAVFVGREHVLERVQAMQPAPRPDMERAFADVAGAQLQCLFVPPQYVRRIVEALVPRFTDELGDIHLTTRSMTSWALGLSLDPAMHLRIVLRAESTEDARRLLQAHALGFPPMAARLPALPQATPFELRGDRLELRLDSQGMVRYVDDALLPWLLDTLVYSNRPFDAIEKPPCTPDELQVILLALNRYLARHGDIWPHDLDRALREIAGGNADDGAKVPARPALGLNYLRPSAPRRELTDPSQRMILYPTFVHWPNDGVAVGCADLRVRIVTSEAEFHTLRTRGDP